jgi:predicted Zn-dependent protease
VLPPAAQADGAESVAEARPPGSSQKDISPRQRAEALYARALQQLQDARGSDARTSLQEALILWPGLEDARLLWAALLIEDRQLGRAETLLHDGLGAQTGAPLVLTLARLKVERGEEAAALALLQAHDAVATQDADFQALAAALYLRAGQHEQATERYRRALALGPGQSVWWAGLGLAQSAQAGQQAQALRSLRHALSLQGLSPSLRDRLLLRVAELQRAEAQP